MEPYVRRVESPVRSSGRVQATTRQLSPAARQCAGRAGKAFLILASEFPLAEGVLVLGHVHAFAAEFHAFKLQSEPLLVSGFTL